MYQYTLTMNEVTPEDKEILKGDRFYCHRTVEMDDNPKDIAYTKGKTYISEHEGCITDDQGEKQHGWRNEDDEDEWWDFFTKTPHPVETCGCDRCKPHKKPDRDYFQSIQEENKPTGIAPSETEAKIIEQCTAIQNLLISKNRKYANSALTRGRVFNMSPVVSIKARIEDKLARLTNDRDDEDEDIVLDLLGYFILLRIAQKQEKDSFVEDYSAMFPGK